eukprot:15237761-Alexandrium_andersonii.AAC.1
MRVYVGALVRERADVRMRLACSHDRVLECSCAFARERASECSSERASKNACARLLVCVRVVCASLRVRTRLHVFCV